jgi:hypothetical protein
MAQPEAHEKKPIPASNPFAAVDPFPKTNVAGFLARRAKQEAYILQTGV